MNRALQLAPLLFLLPVARADEPLRFDRYVLAILSDNCFAGHGPDAGARVGDLLRLVVSKGV